MSSSAYLAHYFILFEQYLSLRSLVSLDQIMDLLAAHHYYEEMAPRPVQIPSVKRGCSLVFILPLGN